MQCSQNRAQSAEITTQHADAAALVNAAKARSERVRPEGAPPDPFTCLIHPNATPPLRNLGRVPFLPRSALACWFSIEHLIHTCSPCYLWTFTTAEVIPDCWFGDRHRRLVAYVSNCAKRRTIGSTGGIIFPNWGGVRVFEEHPSGHGLHAHWVMRGRMDWYLMQSCALRAGFGKIVHVNPRPVTAKVAYYLANYLTKNGKLRGVRSWANIGTYDGVGKRDIVITSKRIERIKALHAYFRSIGHHRFTAYRLAIQEVNEQDKGADVPF